VTSNQQINAVFPSPSFSVDYLFYAVCTAAPKIKAQAGEQAVPIVNKTQFSETAVAIPPLPEQRAIAGALSDVDELLGALDQLIAKKRDLKQAAMQQLLTGQTRLPGFHGKWDVNPLRKFVRQFIVPMRDKPTRLTGDIPWCRIEDFDGTYLEGSKSGQGVDADTIQAMNLKVYPAGTLLVSCSADLGRCAVVARPLVSNQTFIGLEMDGDAASNVFFYYLMTSKAVELNNLSSGTTISYLSREQFEGFAVSAPLDKTEQTAIAEVLTDMDAELAALEQRRAKTRALKQGMMQELLTGRTRLV
jgi:type I restriction enzyme S subunit